MAASQVASKDAHLLVFMLLCYLLPLRRGQDLVTQQWIEYHRGHSQDSVTKRRWPCLACPSHSCWGKPALWTALWRDPLGKKLSQAFSQQPVKSWGPQSEGLNPLCQQTRELGNGACCITFIWNLSPSQHDCSLVRNLETKAPAKLCLDFWPTEVVRYVCSFKPQAWV